MTEASNRKIAMTNVVINEAHTIESVTINENEDDTIIIRCVGEDNLLSMVDHIKKFNGKIY